MTMDIQNCESPPGFNLAIAESKLLKPDSNRDADASAGRAGELRRRSGTGMNRCAMSGFSIRRRASGFVCIDSRFVWTRWPVSRYSLVLIPRWTIARPGPPNIGHSSNSISEQNTKLHPTVSDSLPDRYAPCISHDVSDCRQRVKRINIWILSSIPITGRWPPLFPSEDSSPRAGTVPTASVPSGPNPEWAKTPDVEPRPMTSEMMATASGTVT